ncbi:MAG: hypothetical protein AB7G28_00705 [Pirellulales bacterium]
MAQPEFLEVDPATLHLPGSRRDGADLAKLLRQFSRFGLSTNGMPPLQVSRGTDGELVINDGVTRATQIARYAPGTLVTVEVIDDIPIAVASLPTVGENL